MLRFVIVLCLLFCSGCSTTFFSKPTERVPLALSDPQPMSLQDVTFTVVHKDNAEKVFQDLEQAGSEPVIFALSGPDYKALASNISQIMGYIKVQKRIIVLYREYYEPKAK